LTWLFFLLGFFGAGCRRRSAMAAARGFERADSFLERTKLIFNFLRNFPMEAGHALVQIGPSLGLVFLERTRGFKDERL
jgi:hypothetical protein